jgi:hypothetical protein
MLSSSPVTCIPATRCCSMPAVRAMGWAE